MDVRALVRAAPPSPTFSWFGVTARRASDVGQLGKSNEVLLPNQESQTVMGASHASILG